jgi:hypothetical protein
MKCVVETSHTGWTQEMELTRRQIMKRMAYQCTYPTIFAVLVLTLFATNALASARPSRVDHAEVRIKELHTKLKITKEQEGLWHNVTEVMRENAQTMDALNKARFEHPKSMTAVDDFTSYAAIAAAHAEGLKKFVPVFETLYASMSDAQKQNADTLFRQHRHMRAKGK